MTTTHTDKVTVTKQQCVWTLCVHNTNALVDCKNESKFGYTQNNTHANHNGHTVVKTKYDISNLQTRAFIIILLLLLLYCLLYY